MSSSPSASAGVVGPGPSAAALPRCLPLDAVEALRVSFVLEGTLEKLSFLSALAPDILSDALLSAESGGRAAVLIREQHILERRYDEAVRQRAEARRLGNKTHYRELAGEVQTLTYQLRNGLKTLCGALRSGSSARASLDSLSAAQGAMLALVEATLGDLGAGNGAGGGGGGARLPSRLAAFLADDVKGRERARFAASREEEILAEVETLAATLRTEAEKHAAEIALRRAEILELKERLRRLKLDTTLTLRYTRAETAALVEAKTLACSAEEAAMAEECASLRAKIARERRASEATAEVLKKETEEYAKATEEWTHKRERDLETARANAHTLHAAREQQARDLVRFRAMFEDELSELRAIEAAAEAKRDAEERGAQEAARKSAAASQLQLVLGDMFAIVGAEAAEKPKTKAAPAKAKK